MGDTVTLFVDRCVMCSRCVRFTREITGTSELMVINRGAHEEIDVFPGYPLENKMSGNVVDLCPVGALGDVDFLYEQRVWFMKKQANVCAGCSTGCSIFTEQNQDRVYRLKPRENEHVNQWWMCDEGRYGWHHLHSNERLTELRRVNDEGVHENVEWEHLPEKLSADLRAAGKLAVSLSPFLTVEEAFLLAKYARSLDLEALIAVGHIPVVGEDETFPNGFTIRAEKCPNRRGVEAVAAALQGELIAWEDLPERMAKVGSQALWVTGGYKKDWIDEAAATALAEQVELLLVEDMFPSPLWERAAWQIPSAGFAEKAGSYVNANDWIQSFSWAIRPPQGVMSEGQLYWRLAQRQGLYQPAEVLEDVARSIGYFSAIGGKVPELGMDLKVNQLAGV